MKTAELLHKYVPSVKTIGGYARIDNFYDKTEEQLRNMAAAGYANPYIGVESGNDVVLKRINKGYTAARAREQPEKIDGILREEKQQMLDALAWSMEHVDEGRISRTSRVGTL